MPLPLGSHHLLSVREAPFNSHHTLNGLVHLACDGSLQSIKLLEEPIERSRKGRVQWNSEGQMSNGSSNVLWKVGQK